MCSLDVSVNSLSALKPSAVALTLLPFNCKLSAYRYRSTLPCTCLGVLQTMKRAKHSLVRHIIAQDNGHPSATPVLMVIGTLLQPAALNTRSVLLTITSHALTHCVLGSSWWMSANNACLGSLLKHFDTSATAPLISRSLTAASSNLSVIATIMFCTQVPLMPPRLASLAQVEIQSRSCFARILPYTLHSVAGTVIGLIDVGFVSFDSPFGIMQMTPRLSLCGHNSVVSHCLKNAAIMSSYPFVSSASSATFQPSRPLALLVFICKMLFLRSLPHVLSRNRWQVCSFEEVQYKFPFSGGNWVKSGEDGFPCFLHLVVHLLGFRCGNFDRERVVLRQSHVAAVDFIGVVFTFLTCLVPLVLCFKTIPGRIVAGHCIHIFSSVLSCKVAFSS